MAAGDAEGEPKKRRRRVVAKAMVGGCVCECGETQLRDSGGIYSCMRGVRRENGRISTSKVKH